MKTTEENNKLIAEFMGIVFHDDKNQYYSPDGFYIGLDLKYHTSWDWLMPVVEKINNTERYEVCIGDCHCHITDIENDNHKVRALTLSLQGETTMGAVYLAIVEFINWHNEYNIVELIKQAKEFWSKIAKENKWSMKDRGVTVWVNEEMEFVDSCYNPEGSSSSFIVDYESNDLIEEIIMEQDIDK